jgi:PAS domain S-box-containing protein
MTAVLITAIARGHLLLFHSLAELFAISVAVITFVVAWYAHAFSRNYYLLFIGIGYFWIAVLDLLHTFAYPNMPLLPNAGGHLSTQYWIATRYLESALILTAPLFLSRKFRPIPVFVLFGVIATAIVAAISSGLFPVTYVKGVGLTSFKVVSEYLIAGILLAALAHLWPKRSLLEGRVFGLMVGSILLTIAAEMAFTFYVEVFGISNLAGHVLKLFSYWLIFLAIIRTTLAEPFAVMARNANSFDAIPDPTIVVDRDGVIQQANASACEAASLAPNEIVGRHCHALFHPSEMDPAACPICRMVATGGTLLDSPHQSPSAGRWWEYSITPIDMRGAHTASVHVRKDSTRRMDAQRQLRVLNSAIAQVQLGVMITDKNGIIEYVNPAFEATTGYALAEIRGQNPRFLKSGQTPQATYARMWEQIATKRPWRGELLNKRKNGGTYWGEVAISPVLDDHGAISHFIAIQEDITKRRKTEDMILRLGRMVDDSLNQIYVLDAESLRILQVNRGAVEALGHPRRELSNKAITDVMDSADAAAFKAMLRPLDMDEAKFVHIDTTLLRSDESACAVHFRVRRVSTENPPVYLVVGEDITEKQRTEAALRQSSKMESIGRLTGGIAHDFNNLLGIIVGNLDMLEEDLEDVPGDFIELGAAQRAALRGADLTRRLLAFSRHTPRKESVLDVGELIDDMVPMLERLTAESVNLSVRRSDNLWLTEIDGGEFEDSVLNLSLNALDAMPDGGDLFVTLENRKVTTASDEFAKGVKPGEYVVVSITDSGSGIPQDIQDQIFEPFFSTKPKDKGTGLGLSMVYGFVGRSKGAVLLDSALGKGTTFHLFLPRIKGEDLADKARTEASPAPVPGGSETVLIVDDEADLVRVGAAHLKSLGYATQTAYDPEAALRLLEDPENKVDLLFTDIVMPGAMTGLDLAETATRANPELKCLITTGHAEEKFMDDERWQTRWPVLLKPYRKDVLAREIRAALDRPADATRPPS